MSKPFIRFFIVISFFMLSACTSTVRGVNYELYKGRLQAQTYLTGRAYKPRPMVISQKKTRPKKHIQRVLNKQQRYQNAKNREKKMTVRQAISNTKQVYRRPIVKVRKAYKPAMRSNKKIQPYRSARTLDQRSLVRAQQRNPKIAYTYKRPVVRKPYTTPPRIAVVQRLVVRRVHVAPPRKAVLPQPITPQIPVSQLNDALFNAAKGGNIGKINSLLHQGAQVNSANTSRETALHAAAALGRSHAVNLLLQKGANPNATTTGGWTPLHSAARFKHTQVARLLVARGAQVNTRNSQGKTPVALATQVGASTTATVLMTLGGR
jgi:hypothetical protein